MSTPRITRKDVEILKNDWMEDPIWDIEDTEGFEQFRDELLQFRKDKELEIANKIAKEIERRAEDLGIKGNIKLMEYIEKLERQIAEMNKKIDSLTNQ